MLLRDRVNFFLLLACVLVSPLGKYFKYIVFLLKELSLFILRRTTDIFDFRFKTRTFLSGIYPSLLFGEMMSCLLISDWLATIQWPFKGFLGTQVSKRKVERFIRELLIIFLFKRKIKNLVYYKIFWTIFNLHKNISCVMRVSVRSNCNLLRDTVTGIFRLFSKYC